MATLSDDPDAPRPGRGSEIVSRAPARSPSRVLVVDDDRDTADSLALLLTLLGRQVETVYDGPAALAAVELRPPDFVLLDLGLPGMDGYEVARRLRTGPGRDGLTIIAVSGYGRPEDKRRAREAGCDAHLTKPADPEALFVLLADR